jgi:hypothetical protein
MVMGRGLCKSLVPCAALLAFAGTVFAQEVERLDIWYVDVLNRNIYQVQPSLVTC